MIVVGAGMCVSYIHLIDRERAIVQRQCEFNTAFLTAVRARTGITNENQQAVNDLLLGFADYFLTLDQQDPKSTALFRRFKTSAQKREAYIKTHPLPSLPENGC